MMQNCFGHDGVTGTSAWVDKDRKITFVILTNNGHPNDDHQFVHYKSRLADAIITAFDNGQH